MATKNIDSISVFLETVDEGVRSAKANDTPAPPRAPRAAVRGLGLSDAARTLLEELRAAPDGAASAGTLQQDLRLGVLELGRAVDELVTRRLVDVEGETLRLTEPDV